MRKLLELLGESGAIEIIHEDLHERGAVEIREARNFADDADVAEAFDGLLHPTQR